MTIAMKLREILEIQPGTLIKGLHVSHSGSVRLSINGWKFDQKRLVNGLWTTVDRDSFSFSYYEHTRVANQIETNKIHPYAINNLHFATLRKNGDSYYKDITQWVGHERIEEGDCVGMSLGENFIAIQPSHVDMYRPDYYELFLFHKVLHGDGIKWIVLQSKSISKNSVILKTNSILLDIVMELAA